MSDENPFLGHQNANNVESVGFTGLPMATYPHSGRSDQFPPLPPVHGFDWSAEFSAGTRLYLNKGNRPRPLGDEVYVAVPIPEPAL